MIVERKREIEAGDNLVIQAKQRERLAKQRVTAAGDNPAIEERKRGIVVRKRGIQAQQREHKAGNHY